MKLNNVTGMLIVAGIALATSCLVAQTNRNTNHNTNHNRSDSSQVRRAYPVNSSSPGRSGAMQQASDIATTVADSAGQIQLVQFVDGGCGCDSGDCGCGGQIGAIGSTGFDMGCGCSAPGMECDACSSAGPGNAGGCKHGGLIPKRPPELSRVPHPPICQAPGPVKSILGVNEFVGASIGREPGFRDSQLVPWEMFAYGEYIGPHRTPHVPEYRLRVDDQLEFVYFLNRRQSMRAYRIFVGDQIRISSATDAEINQREITVLSDGMVSLPLIGQVRAAQKTIADLQDELNELYEKFLTDPAILVQVVEGDTPLRDILDSVDARGGVGGQLRQATVSPDGTVQLPVIGSVPAVGLTLDEIRREINARYRDRVPGLEITPVLVERAPRFIYVVGQVNQPGRFELVGPTTVLQALALAESDLQGGNLRNIIVLRRDEAWRLTATRLDLSGTLFGRRPLPSDEIFLRDSDIIVVPRKPIQRLSEAVDVYLTSTLYSIFPQQLIFDLDNFGGVGF